MLVRVLLLKVVFYDRFFFGIGIFLIGICCNCLGRGILFCLYGCSLLIDFWVIGWVLYFVLVGVELFVVGSICFFYDEVCLVGTANKPIGGCFSKDVIVSGFVSLVD